MNTNDVLNKLIAEIERRIESWDIRGKNSPAGQGKDTCVSRVTELSDLLSFITSLQQEQPIPRWIHANYSDKPEIRYTPSGTPYLQNGPHMIWLSDLERLPKDGTDLTNPIQEQPSLPRNLDEAAEEYAKNRAKDPEQCYEYLYYELIDAVRFGAQLMAKQGVIKKNKNKN